MRSFLGALGLSALALACGCSSGTFINGRLNPRTTTPQNLQPTAMSLSVTSFDFGANVLNNTVLRKAVEVTNTGGATLGLAPSLTGDGSFSLDLFPSCGTLLPAGSSCYMVIGYTPVTVGQQTATLNLNPANVPAGTPSTVAIKGTSAMLQAGTVEATNNPQVALYTITSPFPGKVSVRYGSLRYGLSTWSVMSDGVNPTKIYVAGMLANTQYHMQAVIKLDGGATVTDVDHTFTTSSFPTGKLPKIAVSFPGGGWPQPGIEVMDQVLQKGNPNNVLSAYVTDLRGNLIWGYNIPDADASTSVQAVKFMQNGDVALILSPVPSSGGPVTGNTLSVLREIDLAGNTVQQVSLNELNQRLSSAGFNLTLADIHHDVTLLPNGHFLLIGSVFEEIDPVAGYTGPQYVLGDAIIDLDPSMNPVWVWNEFDHLDVNRHPYLFPDWTHTNAVVYSPSDGNILVSIRHQNWVIKVNYANGTGDGSILWRLGEGGDFTLKNGADPTDWEYAQHSPAIVGSNSAGIFQLTLMDNGDDRIFPSGVTCGTGSAPPCLYTTIPIFQINESAKTATLVFHQILPTAKYSLFGGNSEVLPNGNVEYDLCNQPGPSSEVDEVTNSSSPQTVWRLTETGANLYRSHRIPSLYPGVQWSGTDF